jgi:hypothetical protein
VSGGGSRCTGHGKTRYIAIRNTIVPVNAATTRPARRSRSLQAPQRIVIKP